MSKSKQTIRIAVAEFVNRNMGDLVIADCVAMLLKRHFGRSMKDIRFLRYSLSSGDYAILESVDAIVFAGGGVIKFRQEQFYEHVCNICAFAQEQGIPVFFHAVGVEGYDEEDPRCLALRDMFRLPCIKGITTRDDVELLQETYLSGTPLVAKRVWDTAIFTGRVYRHKKNKNAAEVGIGVIREGVFADYGHPEVTKDKQLAFWSGVANELDRRGIPWRFFTNGTPTDEQMVTDVLEHMGIQDAEKHRMPQPLSGELLSRGISGFRGVIAARMHSNIVAYSLGIPSVGVVWNEKLRKWGELTKQSENYLDPSELDPVLAVERLLSNKRRRKGYSLSRYRKTMKPLMRFIRSLQPREGRRTEQIADWHKRMIAIAGGGDVNRYRGMNTVSVLRNSLADGCRMVELDVRLSADNVLVAVDGWNDTIKTRLGLSQETELPLSAEEFLSKMYYGHYATASFEELLTVLEEYPGCQVMLDIGKPGDELADQLLEELKKLYEAHPTMLKRCRIRIQRRGVAARVKEILPGAPMIMNYTANLETEAESIDSNIRFCKKYKTKKIVVPAALLTEELCAAFNEAGIEIHVFAASTVTDMLKYYAMGAKAVATNYHRVSYMKDLMS